MKKWFLLFLFLFACAENNQKKNYLLAEQLLEKKNYELALQQFKKVLQQSNESELTIQANYEIGKIYFFYLSKSSEALEFFQKYIELSKNKNQQYYQAKMFIGDIFFKKIKNYNQAILYYSSLLNENLSDQQMATIIYRLGRSHFFLWEFDRAIYFYKILMEKYTDSMESKNIEFNLGNSYVSLAEKSTDQKVEKENYLTAISYFEKSLLKQKKSDNSIFVQFALAEAYFHIEQYEKAKINYEEIKERYPGKKIIFSKLSKINEKLKK